MVCYPVLNKNSVSSHMKNAKTKSSQIFEISIRAKHKTAEIGLTYWLVLLPTKYIKTNWTNYLGIINSKLLTSNVHTIKC